MKPFRDNREPLIGLGIVIGIVLFALGVTALTQQRDKHVLALIPAIHTSAPTTGGGSIPIFSLFNQARKNNPWCKAPVSRVKKGIHGVYRQRFQRCEIAVGPVNVYRFQSARRPTPVAPPVSLPTPDPTLANPGYPPLEIPTPVVYYYYPTAVPVAPPASTADSPVQYELYLMNQSRAALGLPAYSLNDLQSNGTGSCRGSIGHSQDMQASGTIWHENSSYPNESFPNNFCVSGYRAIAQNVGMAGGYSVNGSLDVIHQQMMSEPYSPGCQGNHRCSIVSTSYTSVGIGVYTSNGSTYMTVDFIG